MVIGTVNHKLSPVLKSVRANVRQRWPSCLAASGSLLTIAAVQGTIASPVDVRARLSASSRGGFEG
jgi:hypothetical protein